MINIRSFKDAHLALQRAYGTSKTMPYTLERMRLLLAFLDNPQNDLRVIHVAGTSGKTSTAYYVAALLQQAGYKVGLTVSPHVDEVNERVQIDLVPLPEAEFCKALERFLKLVEQSGVQPSYFELMIALAFYEFRRRAVDYAVIEVGLGGLLDATNTIDREDKVCVITDIGLDHTEILGKDLAAIAAQKAGIILPHNHVFLYEQSPEVMGVVAQAAGARGATVYLVSPVSLPASRELPWFQQRNFELAKSAVDFVLVRSGHAPLTAEHQAAAARTYIPARMEIVGLDNKTLIIDGAHNAQKIETLLASVHARYPDQPIAAVVAFLSGHDSRWQQALDVLLPAVSEFILTSFAAEQDVPKTAESPEQLAAYCRRRGFTNYRIETDPVRAFQLLCTSKSPIQLVTGSFYLLNHIRPLVRHR